MVTLSGMKTSRAAAACRSFVLLALVACLQSAGITPSEHAGDVRRFKWQVDYLYWSPDCVERVLIAVNGQFPGPTIRGRQGDVVVVEVENRMATEGVVIHWHGIRQIGTPWSDGTASVSQCAINPGETFIYRFLLDKAGTFSYHGLFGLQRSAGLYGSLIVDLPPGKTEPFQYDGELSILVADWRHRDIYDQELGLSSQQFRWVGEPQSLLIGGRGRYSCALIPKGVSGSGDAAVCNSSNPQCSPYVLPVDPGKTYRLRIASVASLSSLNLVIEKHTMLVVEADGSYVEPVLVENLDMYSGQSYSVLITANQNPTKNYWVGLNVRGRLPSTPTGLAILNYRQNPATRLPTTQPPSSPVWNDFAYSLAQSRRFVARQGCELPVPPKASREIVLLQTQNIVDGRFKWALNNISLDLPATPYLAAMKFWLKDAYDTTPPPDTYAPGYDITVPPRNPNAVLGSGVYKLPLGCTVDVILQNANTLFRNNSEIHPWHLHGHNFWILGHGKGVFDPKKDPSSYNLKNPLVRNTVPVFPYGWTAIRFKADNPGAWLFHCHIDAHFLLGMGVIFAEGVEWVEWLPRSTMGCGLTKELLPFYFEEVKG